MALTAGQRDDLGSAVSVSDQMDFGIAPAAAGPDPTRTPLFRRPALADRWTLICVLSSKASAGGPPARASSMNTRSQIPRTAQRTNRLYSVLRGPYSNGASDHRQPEMMTWMMPLITRRSSTRRLPRM